MRSDHFNIGYRICWHLKLFLIEVAFFGGLKMASTPGRLGSGEWLQVLSAYPLLIHRWQQPRPRPHRSRSPWPPRCLPSPSSPRSSWWRLHRAPAERRASVESNSKSASRSSTAASGTASLTATTWARTTSAEAETSTPAGVPLGWTPWAAWEPGVKLEPLVLSWKRIMENV